MATYELPYRFIQDCEESDCDIGTVLRMKGRRCILEADENQIAELESRARYYSDPYGPDAAPAGLRTAAVALVVALNKAKESA